MKHAMIILFIYLLIVKALIKNEQLGNSVEQVLRVYIYETGISYSHWYSRRSVSAGLGTLTDNHASLATENFNLSWE